MSDHAQQFKHMIAALFMLLASTRKKASNHSISTPYTFALSMLPVELSHKLLALNALLAYRAVRFEKSLLSTNIGSYTAVAYCVSLKRFYDTFRSNMMCKYYIRKSLQDSGIPMDKLNQIGKLKWKEWLSICVPLPQSLVVPTCHPKVLSQETVTYAYFGHENVKRLNMDVYRRADVENAPVMVYVHGGGWILGSRKHPPYSLVYQVASQGWIVCVVDYRLGPHHLFPAQIIDVKRAIAFVRNHGRARFGANSSFIVVAGESAGGHLASLAALTSTDTSLQPGFEKDDTSVKACIDLYGVHDFADRHGIYYKKLRDYRYTDALELLIIKERLADDPEAYNRGSPLYLMQKLIESAKNVHLPPFFMAHGVDDTLVPIEDTLTFYSALKEYRAKCGDAACVQDILLQIPDTNHQFHYVLTPRALALGHSVCAFLEHLYGRVEFTSDKSEAASPVTNHRAIVSAPLPSLRCRTSKL